MSGVKPKVVIANEAEPLTILECYQHLRLDPLDDIDSDGVGTRPDDALIMGYQAAAREACEAFTGLTLAAKTFTLTYSAFPAEIVIPNPPLVQVISIVYDGESSDSVMPAEDYVVDESGELPIIRPVSAWPTINAGNYAVVTYRAGYAVPGDESEPAPLPPWARIGILLILEHLYRNRGATTDTQPVELPLGVEYIMRPHRVRLGMA